MTSTLIALLLSAAAGGAPASGQVRGTPHDLTRGAATSAAPGGATGGPCGYCHASHDAGPGLSSRPDPGNQHVPYASATMATRPGAPTGATRACLSCHDGTIAPGQTRISLRQGAAAASAGAPLAAARPANLGTDLRRGHPVSFTPAPGGDVHPPPAGDAVRLDPSGQVQCTSCHDPHRQFGGDPTGQFLVKSTRRSALCLTCHAASAVAAAGSSHASSAKPFGPAEGNAANAASVADAGCAACHVQHGAQPGERLVRRGPAEGEDAPCLRCHASSVVNVPMGAEYERPYAHARAARGVHDAAEGRPGAARPLPETSSAAPRHVTCVDCHNPHAAADRAATGGTVGGALAGVWGISQNGQRVDRVRFEYEVCFKCHGDSANKPQALGRAAPGAPRRAVADANLRRAFDPGAISSHPVVAPGRNPDVPSLIPPLTTSSVITCSDCHGSDRGPGVGGPGPRGPHGSIHAGLLERPYLTADLTVEGPTAYALCYKCHDREKLLRSADSPFKALDGRPLHQLHVVDRATPCSACHASHGVSSTAGVRGENERLIDFDLNVVRPGPGGRAVYQSQGPRHGSCAVSCHGATHAPATY